MFDSLSSLFALKSHFSIKFVMTGLEIGIFILNFITFYLKKKPNNFTLKRDLYNSGMNVITVNFHKCCQVPAEGLNWTTCSPVSETVVLI